MPARSADVVAFLAAERGRGLSINTVELRRAAIRYLHFIAGCPVPTAEAHVTETVSVMRRHAADQGEQPAKKLTATADILREILCRIPEDLPGLRDRALLLVGFAGALRRSELAAIRVEHLERRERGLRLTLPRSRGERTGKAVAVRCVSAASRDARSGPRGRTGLTQLQSREKRPSARLRRRWRTDVRPRLAPRSLMSSPGECSPEVGVENSPLCCVSIHVASVCRGRMRWFELGNWS